MALKQVATRIDEQQYELFRETAHRLGMTPTDALRMFIYAFNEHHGFPYEVKTASFPEPFETEVEASRFATAFALETMDETR